MLKDFLPLFYVFSNAKGIMRKISLRSFSHNVLFIPHAVFFSQKTKNMFYPLLASLLIIEHKVTKKIQSSTLTITITITKMK